MEIEDDENPVLLEIKPRGYSIATHDYMLPTSARHSWTLKDLQHALSESGFTIVRKEDQRVLDECARAVLLGEAEPELIGPAAQQNIWKAEKARRAARNARALKKEKLAPVQADMRDPKTQELREGKPGYVAGTIAWAEHLEAYIVYAAKFGRKQSAAKIAERGGFGYLELVSFLGREPTTWKANQTHVRSRTLKL